MSGRCEHTLEVRNDRGTKQVVTCVTCNALVGVESLLARCLTAEARVAELEAALREALEWWPPGMDVERRDECRRVLAGKEGA